MAANLAPINATSNLVTTAGGPGTVPLYGTAGGKESIKGYNLYAQLRFSPT
jgi:hypothetical protein